MSFNKEVQFRVRRHAGFNPKASWIADVKEELGMPVRRSRIVLANESILAHRRSVMRSSKHSEPRWREAFLVTILGVVCWRTVRHGSKSGSASTSVVASIRPCASDRYTPPVRMRSRAGGDVSSCGIVGAESTKPPSSTRSASYRRDDVFNAVRADCGSQGPPGEPALRCCTQSG